MFRIAILVVAVFWASLCSAAIFRTGGGTAPPPGVDTPFTALTTYYIAPTTATPAGNNANSGLDAAHPKADPNISGLHCGDVIIAAPSTAYTSSVVPTVAPTNCPSTSGGIDGTGGIQFAVLLCGGANVGDCSTTNTLWQMPSGHWSVQGWKVANNSDTGGLGRAFNMNGCSAIIGYFAFINNITDTVSSGFHTDDCGLGAGFGVDYVAVVGNIAHNSSQNASTCEAAIDDVGPGALDTAAGTHVYFHKNFTWYNQAAGCVASFDSEGIMFDSWDARSYNNLGVISENVVWGSMRYCIQLFTPDSATSNPSMKVYNNTCYNNNTNIGGDFADGEINIALGRTWTISVTNNIAKNTNTDTHHYAMVNGGGANTGTTVGGTGVENVFKGASPSCISGSCAGTNDVAAFNGNTFAANFYTDPTFSNAADIDANWQSGAVNCAGFETTIQCMGYDAYTRTLTALKPISDLTAGCAQCSGKGFTLPTTACGAVPDFPTWVKGVIYLHVNVSGAIVQRHGLAKTPCGL